MRELAGVDAAHARHFQVSMLRVFGPSVPTAEVDEAEAHYERALLTRQHGLNRNQLLSPRRIEPTRRSDGHDTRGADRQGGFWEPSRGGAARPCRRAASVETNDTDSYITVRPSGRHIAEYFNRKFVDVAVDPLTSQALAAQYPGVQIHPKTTATHDIRVPANLVGQIALDELVAAALD